MTRGEVPKSNRNSMMDKSRMNLKFDPPRTAEIFKNIRQSTKQHTSRAHSTLRSNTIDDDGLDAFMNDTLKGGGAFKINPRFRQQ